MAVDNSFIIRKIQSRTSMYVAYCAFTGMPLLVQDPETFNDQVWIFQTEKLLQEFAKEYTAKKLLLRGVQYKNKDFLRFYSSLFTMGVNEVVFVNEGEGNKLCVDLRSIVREPDYSKLKPEQRPVLNPNLQLIGIYFMQEAARQVPTEEKEDLQDLEEEFAANLMKAKYMMAVEIENGPGTLADKLKEHKYKLPILKDKNGNVHQPLFTDPLEFQKFTKGKKMEAIQVPFAQLIRLLSPEAKGYMLNPAGFHILMPRELLETLPKRF